ncbi:hypothetical protein ACFXPI_03800 [Streptomyces sp. NPDC059104]|uniref:hypothetical protein n=1 Tax=Streptomyces sp. NPDC059104 TaxID=3346729 RepID=UPI0036BA1214
MTRVTGTTPEGERPVERLLREALTARAQEVTIVTLRPADPPGPHLRRLSLRTPWVRRSAWTLAGLSGLAAALAGFLLLGPDPAAPRPVPPASPPEFTSPTPSGSPRPSEPPSASVSPPPSPAPSRPPSTGPAAGATPSRAPRTAPPTAPAGGEPGTGAGMFSASPSALRTAGSTPSPTPPGN